MAKKHILIVDDELAIIKLLRASLQARDYEVFSATNGAEALRALEIELPDLLILDITMPKMDGFEVCRQLREWSQIPIIMLSARGDETDKVKCLDLGADDYVTKPFSTNELMARVRSVLRRSESTTAIPKRASFITDDFQINFAERRITVAGDEAKFTPTEYNLLQELVLNAGKVLTHSYLLKKVWGPEYQDEKEYLHVFARRLRLKLEPNPSNPKYIMTVPGVGYQFKNNA